MELTVFYFYQNPNKESLRADYSKGLLKIASMADEMETFFEKVVRKIWDYLDDKQTCFGIRRFHRFPQIKIGNLRESAKSAEK